MSYTKCTIEEGGSSIHVPFKISYTATSVQYVQLNLIINILPVGVQLSPLELQASCWASFSVSEKLDTVHKVYDRRGGLKYTCTLQN